MRESLLEVKAERVVDFRGNTGQAERFLQFVAASGANGELIVNVVVIGRRNRWQTDKFGQVLGFEEFAVARGAILTAFFPSIQVAQFHARDGSLQGVET